MARNLEFKIHNYRLMSSGSLMVFDLGIGYNDGSTFIGVADVRGCWLKQKNDGSGNYVQFPSKLRVKDGQPVEDDKGYKIYDNVVDLFMEKGANPDKPDTRAPTEAAWGFRKWLIEEATKVYKAASKSESGRGEAKAGAPRPAAAKPASRPVGASTRTADVPKDDDGGDPDWPF
jgi:hypothetical protein